MACCLFSCCFCGCQLFVLTLLPAVISVVYWLQPFGIAKTMRGLFRQILHGACLAQVMRFSRPPVFHQLASCKTHWSRCHSLPLPPALVIHALTHVVPCWLLLPSIVVDFICFFAYLFRCFLLTLFVYLFLCLLFTLFVFVSLFLCFLSTSLVSLFICFFVSCWLDLFPCFFRYLFLVDFFI